MVGRRRFNILYFGNEAGVASECEDCGPLGVDVDQDTALAMGKKHLIEVHKCYTTSEEQP